MNREFFELLVLACSALGVVWLVASLVVDAVVDRVEGYFLRRRARRILARIRTEPVARRGR